MEKAAAITPPSDDRATSVALVGLRIALTALVHALADTAQRQQSLALARGMLEHIPPDAFSVGEWDVLVDFAVTSFQDPEPPDGAPG